MPLPMLITLLILFPILIYLIELWQLKKHRMNAGVLLLIICCGWLFLLVLLYCLLGLFNLKLVEDGYVDSNLNTFSMLFYVSVIVLSIVWVIVNVIINYIMHWKIKTGQWSLKIENYYWVPTFFAWIVMVKIVIAVIKVYLIPSLHIGRDSIIRILLIIAWYFTALVILKLVDQLVHGIGRHWAISKSAQQEKNWFQSRKKRRTRKQKRKQ